MDCFSGNLQQWWVYKGLVQYENDCISVFDCRYGFLLEENPGNRFEQDDNHEVSLYQRVKCNYFCINNRI